MTISLRPHQIRALAAMDKHEKGQIVVPTGGGKTFIMIQHAIRMIQRNGFDYETRRPATKTIVVVAPRILLAQQLCNEFVSLFDKYQLPRIAYLHVHSGKLTDYENTTDPTRIYDWAVGNWKRNQIIFTTYHSLHKIQESGVNPDILYYDEAHNSTARSFFPAVDHFSEQATKNYFFTATPKYSTNLSRQMGMNVPTVYGDIICNVAAKELIEVGSIIPPTIIPFDTDLTRTRGTEHEYDVDATLSVLDELDEDINAKVVVSIGSSKVLDRMLGKTSLLNELKERGYDVLHVTSKFGAYVNDKKVNRTKFIDTLNKWGKEDDRKFIVFHYSILSEGISVPGLTHCIMLRQLSIIEMAQTIGRVIRMNSDDKMDIERGIIKAGDLKMYRKQTGFVCTPAKSTHTVKRLQRVVDDIFVKGIPPLPLAYK